MCTTTVFCIAGCCHVSAGNRSGAWQQKEAVGASTPMLAPRLPCAHTPTHPSASCAALQTQEVWSFAVPALWLAFFATPEQWARLRAPQNALLMTLFLVHYFNRGEPLGTPLPCFSAAQSPRCTCLCPPGLGLGLPCCAP